MPSKFHSTQIYIAAALVVAFLLAYMFAPPAKEAVVSMGMTTALGFLVGKFSNGFKGKQPYSDSGKDVTREDQG